MKDHDRLDEKIGERKEPIEAADLSGKREQGMLAKLGEPKSHEHLSAICIQLPTDYEPYGYRYRDSNDCSCGCKWFLELAVHPSDWGVCANPRSPRCGLLTFEHQGCQFFEYDPDLDALVEAQIAQLDELQAQKKEKK